MNKEQLLTIIQGGHTTDGDLADAILAELAKGAKHIRTAFLNKDGGVTLLMSRSDPSTHSEFKKYLYTSPLPQPDLVAENERLKALSVNNIMLDVVPGDGSGQEVYAKSVDDVVAVLSDMGERLEALYGKAVILRATIKAQEHWQDQAAQQAAVIEQMREAFRVASMDTETINRKAPEIAKGCCSMPMPDTEGTYHLANEEVCNVVSSYLYWLHKNQPINLQPSPEILQARDERIVAACAQYVYAMGGTKGSVLLAEMLLSGEWRNYL